MCIYTLYSRCILRYSVVHVQAFYMRIQSYMYMYVQIAFLLRQLNIIRSWIVLDIN